MDSPKNFEGTEECSSNESGWTNYIASSPDPIDDELDEDDEDCSNGKQVNKKMARREDVREDAESDDSMASDASSGPSYQGQLYGHVENKQERLYGGQKHHQKEKKKQHDEQMKIAADKETGHKTNSGRRSKKK